MFNSVRKNSRRRNHFAIGFGAVAYLTAMYPQSGFTQTIDYSALEQLFGEPVTTSATGSPENASNVPVNMEIITADQIRRSGARDIPGVLKQVLGVAVMRWNSDNADVGIRGYDQAFSPRVLVLIDGRQVYADHSDYTPWAALPIELGAIRQIEVIKGPNAALFGFNAANGVINIITYNPLYDDVNTVSVSAGTQGLAETSAVKTFKFDGGGIRLSAGGRVDDDFSTAIPASAGNLARVGNDRFAINLNGVFRLNSQIQFGIEATHSTAATNDINPVYALVHDQHYTSSLKGQITAESNLGLVQLTLYHNWVSQHLFTGVLAPVQFNGEETVAQLQDLFKLGPDHVFRAALEYRHNAVGTTPFVGGNIFYDDHAASGMWEWTIVPALSLTSALRWENLHLGRNGAVPDGYPFANGDWNRVVTDFSYSSGLVWRATEIDTLRLIVSGGDQLPSLADFGATLIASPVVNFSGDPRIKNTSIGNYEIDWDRALPGIGAQFRAAAFYLRGEDFILPVPAVTIAGSGPPPYVLPANVGDSSAKGIELSISGKLEENWRWGLNYRFESIADQFVPSVSGGINFIDFEHVTPKHVLKANLGWASARWEIDSYFYYQAPTRGLESLPFNLGSFLSPVPDYFSFDGRIAYRLTDWVTLAISGQNLGVSSQKQTAAGPMVERSVFATFTVNY